MNQIFKFINEIFQLLKPPKLISWQTIIWLGIFSSLFAFFAYILPGNDGMMTANITANFALIFLIIGSFWWLTEKRARIFKIKLRPIVVGLLICVLFLKNTKMNFVFAFGQLAPIICGFMAIIPNYFQNFKFRAPHPEKINQSINIFLIHLLISCWFSFYAFIQDWTKINYPNNFYVNQDFSQSFFVVQIIPSADKKLSISQKISEEIFNYFEIYLKNKLNEKSWSKVEFYLKKLNSQDLKNEINQLLINQIEDSQWTIRLEVETSEKIPEYNLTLWVLWGETKDNPQPYQLKKTCKVRQNFINLHNSNPEFICEKATFNP